jgi:hypothetical protein
MATSTRPTGHVPHGRGRAWFASETRVHGVHPTDLIPFQHFRLLQRLHRIHLACIHFLDEPNLRRNVTLWEREAYDPFLTSPNAPFPMTLTVRKSDKRILVLRSLRCCDSSLRYLRISRSLASPGITPWLIFCSNSIRLCDGENTEAIWTITPDAPTVALDGDVDGELVVGLELEFGSGRAGHGIGRESLGASFKVHIVLATGPACRTRCRRRRAGRGRVASETARTARRLRGRTLTHGSRKEVVERRPQKN